MKLITAVSLTLASSIWLAGTASFATPIPDTCQIGGFAIGCQAWTFKDYSVMEAIEKTAAAGGKVIELYPGQKFSAEKPDLKFDHNSSDEVIAAVQAQLKKYDVRAVNYGVVDLPKDEAGARKIFEFAKKFELYGITIESVDALDTIEKMVKKYDIRVGFHDHQSRPNDPGYKMWDPTYVLSMLKGRDARIGSCADVGHWAQSGLKPVDCLKILRGHIISVHIHDMNDMTGDAHDVPVGTGVCDVAGILRELKRQHFQGNISIEYEANWHDNTVNAGQYIGFVRGYGEK